MPELNTKTAATPAAAADPLFVKFKSEKDAAVNFQKRRHDQWRETYELYRDIVHTNELTQRQAVNIPIMKETKRTLLSRIDEAPSVVFDCLEKEVEGRDKEMFLAEIWQDDFDHCNFEAVDILEKNNVLLSGRTFKILNWRGGRFFCEVPDNLDIVIDPKTSPIDIETARYFTRLHIFRTLKEILADERYTEEGKRQLKNALQSDAVQQIMAFTKDDSQAARDKIIQDLSIENFDTMNAYDAQVELNEHFTNIWDDKAKKWVRHVQIWAMDSVCLSNKPLKEALGVEFWPIISWAEDLDNKDFWNDGIGDVVRTPNKIANIFFSSWLENREYHNLSMYWYLPVPGYSPQSFVPEPFGQYPAPLVKGDDGRYMTIEQVIKRMDIPALEDSMISIDFLVKLVERATAATATEKGTSEKKNITLGEVEEIAAKSAERIVSMAKFYRRSWKEFAWKWLKITEANATGKMKLYKKAFDGSYFEKEVSDKDWKSEKGYKVRVQSVSEQKTEQNDSIKQLMAIKAQMPENVALTKIVNKRLIDFLKLTPEEQKEIEDEQNQPPIIQQQEGQVMSPEAIRLKNSTGQLQKAAGQLV